MPPSINSIKTPDPPLIQLTSIHCSPVSRPLLDCAEDVTLTLFCLGSVTVFDYINPLASTEDISMEDMVSGNPPRMKLLLARIRTNFPGSQP